MDQQVSPAVVVIVLILIIIAIIDVLNSSMDTGKKALWIILILFLPVIGLVLYYLIGRKRAIVNIGK